jgi:PII-like signaling protein
MPLPENAVLLRIFIGESDRWENQPLHEAIVLRARALHLAGATVLRGMMGFGHASRLHSAKILRLSMDLPLVIEIVDAEDKVNAFLPEVGRMIGNGLVTVQPVRVVTFSDTQAAGAGLTRESAAGPK